MNLCFTGIHKKKHFYSIVCKSDVPTCRCFVVVVVVYEKKIEWCYNKNDSLNGSSVARVIRVVVVSNESTYILVHSSSV